MDSHSNCSFTLDDLGDEFDKDPFADSDEDKDTDYNPTEESKITDRKMIPDFFHIHKRRKPNSSLSAEPSCSTTRDTLPASARDLLTPSSSLSTCNESDVRRELPESNKTEETALANRFAYFDGTYYKVLSVNGTRVKAQCLLCIPKFHTINGIVGTSSNFLNHIAVKHAEYVKEYKEHVRVKKNIKQNLNKPTRHSVLENRRNSQPTIREGLSAARPSQEGFNKRLLNFLVNTMSPLSMCENKYFIDLFKGFNVKVMTRKTACNRIVELNTEIKTIIEKELSSIEYVSTTADIWSCKQRSFLGVTCHWIAEDMTRQSAALACRRFSGSHTYDRIAEMLDDIHSSFGLHANKVVATVTDNGSNFVKAFNEFGLNLERTTTDGNPHEILDADDLPLFEEIVDDEYEEEKEKTFVLPRHIRCASHTLNLIATTDVKHALDKNSGLRSKHTSIMAKCSNLWNKSSFPKSAEVIKEILGHHLSYPGVTRWNSHFDAISQLLDCKYKLNEVCLRLNLKTSFKESDFLYLEEYCKILKPLSVGLDKLQGENKNFYGYVLPTIIIIRAKFDKFKKEDFKYTSHILEACKEGLNNRFKDILSLNDKANSAIIAACSVPKFKLYWFNSVQNGSEKTLTEIKQLFIDAVKAEVSTISANPSTATAPAQEEDDFFDFICGPVPSGTSVDMSDIDFEVARYFNDRSVSFESLHNYKYIKKSLLNTIRLFPPVRL